MLIVLELVIALPDDLAVFASGVPDLGAVPASAAAAFDFGGKGVSTAMVLFAPATLLDFTLHHLEHVRLDDGLVVIFYIILWDFTLVDLGLFGQVVEGVGFLEQCITLVFLVAEDAFDGGLAPFLLATRCWDSISSQTVGDSVVGHTLQKHAVDALYGDCLFWIDDQIPIRATVVAKETLKWDGYLTVCKAFSLAPSAVLGNAAAFFLCQ